MARNPEEAQSIMSEATKTDKNLVRDVWNAFNYHLVLDQILLITLEDETRWAMKNHLTDRTVMPDYRNYIHLDSLKELKPEAIRMNQ